MKTETMTNMLFLSFIIPVLSLFLFLLSCGPVSRDIPPEPEPTPLHLRPPEQVSCMVDGENIRVAWDPVDGAEGYKVYRKIGQGNFIEVDEGVCVEEIFSDAAYPYDQVIWYAVKCVSCWGDSPISNPSNPISRNIINLKATRCEYVHKVVVSWNEHTQADSYRVYGYDSKEGVPTLLAATTGTMYEDTDFGGPGDLFYRFYRVTWLSRGREYGEDGAFALGVTASYKDFHEPNDDYTDLEYQPGSTVFSPGQPPLLFSVGDGSGGVYADCDWYKYHGPADFFSVIVALPCDDPAFFDGELFLKFYFSGIYSPAYTLGPGESTCGFGEYRGDETGEVDVYFKLYSAVPSSRSVMSTYTVEIKNGI